MSVERRDFEVVICENTIGSQAARVSCCHEESAGRQRMRPCVNSPVRGLTSCACADELRVRGRAARARTSMRALVRAARARTSCACTYEVSCRGELPAAELLEPAYLDGDVLPPLLRVREHDERLLGLPERAMEPHERFDEPWGRARRGEGLVLESVVVQSLRCRRASGC